MNFYETFSKPLPIILELYLQKLIQRFKYDQCLIARCMKMIYLPEENSISCYIIFLRFYQLCKLTLRALYNTF